MAIIYTYPTKDTPANDDLVLISDSADNNKTKQVKMSNMPGASGAGITQLNGQTLATQSFANDTNVIITSAGGTHTLGWNGTLATTRGGTGLSAVGTRDQVLKVSNTGTLEYADPTVTEVVRNVTGSTIAIGTPVYISGVSGTTPTIAPADATNSTSMPVVGLAAESINNNNTGIIMVTGLLEGINTSAINDPDTTGAEGEIVYVSSSPATTLGLTYKKPTGTNLIQNIGIVVKYSAGTSGSIQVSCIGRTNDLPNLATGRIWAGDANGVPEALAPGSANTVLKSNGSTISWGAPVVDLATGVTGVLSIANGGTGLSTVGTKNQVLKSTGAGALYYSDLNSSFVTLTSGATVNWDITTGDNAYLAMTTGSNALSINNVTDGDTGTLILNGASSTTFSLPDDTNIKSIIPGGTSYTPSANQEKLRFVCRISGGITYFYWSIDANMQTYVP